MNNHSSKTTCGHGGILAAVCALLSILAVYVLLHTRYYIYYVDDCWLVSETYHYMQTGKTEDVLFRRPDAPDRLLLFGKTFFFIYGTFLQWAGWTKSNAHLLSSIFIWLSAGLWFLIARRLNLSRQLQTLLALFVLVFPAFFSAANLARPDALAFFLSSLTFLLFLERHYFLAGLALLISLECHLMGMSGLFYILAYVVFERARSLSDKRESFRSLALFLAGVALGALYYYALHRADFSFARLQTILALKKEMGGFKFGFIVKYFVQRFWYRHVWELLLVAAAVVLFLKHKLWREHTFATVVFPVMIAASYVVSRPNANYMVFIYPAFLLFILQTFEKLDLLRGLRWFAGSALLVLYCGHYIANRSFDFQTVIRETRKSLQNPSLPVVGMPDNWFAVPERTFYPIYPSERRDIRPGLPEFYLIRNDYVANRIRNYKSTVADIEENYDLSLAHRFGAYDRGEVEIYHCRKKNSD
jgi:hypothetical protein